MSAYQMGLSDTRTEMVSSGAETKQKFMTPGTMFAVLGGSIAFVYLFNRFFNQPAKSRGADVSDIEARFAARGRDPKYYGMSGR